MYACVHVCVRTRVAAHMLNKSDTAVEWVYLHLTCLTANTEGRGADRTLVHRTLKLRAGFA